MKACRAYLLSPSSVADRDCVSVLVTQLVCSFSWQQVQLQCANKPSQIARWVGLTLAQCQCCHPDVGSTLAPSNMLCVLRHASCWNLPAPLQAVEVIAKSRPYNRDLHYHRPLSIQRSGPSSLSLWTTHGLVFLHNGNSNTLESHHNTVQYNKTLHIA